MRLRWQLMVPAIVVAVSLAPGIVSAQQIQTRSSMCGADAANVDQFTVLPEGQTTEQAKQEGLQEYAQIQGMVLHGEGNLVLVRIERPTTPGPTTAAPGPSMAVIQIPADCSVVQFPSGAAIVAVGEGTNQGIFEATTMDLAPL